MPTYDEIASGGAVVSGSFFVTHETEVDGGIQFGGSATVSLTYSLEQEIEWDVNATVDITKNVSWNIGLQPIRWYRVQGCCRFPTPSGDGLSEEENEGRGEGGGCDVIPFQSDDSMCTGALGRVQYIQNIPARSLGELCERLKNERWLWEICSIKRFSRTFSNSLVSADDQCNQLEEVPFSEIPECLEFALHTTGVVIVGMSVEVVDNIFITEGSGGIYFGGSGGLVYPSAEGVGGVTFGGSAVIAAQYLSFVGDGGIIFGGDSSSINSDYHYTPEGGIVFGGESSIIFDSYHYFGSGDLIFGGGGEITLNLPYMPSGQSDIYPYFASINFSGDAAYPIRVLPEGGVIFGGSGTYPLKVLGEGGVIFGGESSQVSPSWHYSLASGGVIFGGEAPFETPDLAFSPDGGQLLFGGDGEYRDSSNGEFWYLPSGEILFGGVCDNFITQYRFISGGPLVFGGGSEYSSTWQGEFDVEMGMEAYAESEEIIFGVVDAPAIEAPSTVVVTNCGICTDMPLLLYVHHNLERSGFLNDFLLRNGQEIPQILPMHYSTRHSSWQANYHMRGLGEDNTGSEESWRVIFEWSCVGEIGSLDLGGNAWKFSMLVVRKNLETGVDLDTRILISFPPEEICKKNSNIDFNFSFSLDTGRLHVTTDLDIVVDVILLNDGIGLFKTKFWRNFPNFRIRLSENKNVGGVERKDIKPIFPDQEILVLA